MRAGLLGVLLLGACGGGPATLTMGVAILPSELPVYREVLAEFERREAVRVVLVPQQYADLRRALAAEAAAGEGTLDLVELDVYSLAAAAPHVSVLAPGEVASVLDALAPEALRAGTIDGLRFLPHRLSWQALVYNHAVLGRPPEDWAALLTVARAHPGKIAFKAARYEGLSCDLLPFVWAAGGSGERLDDGGARTAFHFFAELAPYLHPRSATLKEPTVAEAMARGEILVHLNWPFVMSLYASQGLAPDPIRSAPLPRGPKGRATVLGGGYIAVPKNAPHRSHALALARHLLARETQETFARRLGWFPVRRDVAVGETSEALAGFAAMRAHVRPRPERADYPRLSRLWQQAFRAVVFEGADPDATLAAAARTLE